MQNNILIIGPSWVGDMVMAQVLFKILRQQTPNANIDVLAPAWSLPVIDRMPEINKAIEINVAHGEFGLAKRYRLAKQLRKNNYDIAIVLTNSWKSALIPFLARIPRRIGWLGEMRFGLLTDARILSKKALPKMVQRYAALAFAKDEDLPKDLPSPKLLSPKENVKEVIQKFAIDSSRPILALCAGAAYGPAKRWPPEYFAEIANERAKQGWQIWFQTGSRSH